MTQNPNWPAIDYAVCWSAGPQQTPNQPYWCSMLERTQDAMTSRRGKQYELDQVQPGELDLSLANKDGALDPQNTGSPFAPYVIPYRLFRMRAQYPATRNISIAEGSPRSLPFTAPAVGSQLTQVRSWSVAPGVTFSGSMRVASTAAIGLQVGFAWYNAAGALISQPLGTAATVTGQVTISVTATAPINAAGGALVLLNTTSPASGTVTADQIQIERGAAPTAFVTPGTWYPIFTGYVQKWPQRWQSSGNYGISDIVLIDYFAFLSQRTMLAPFAADLMALGPNFLYQLNETAGTNAFADLTNNRGPALITKSNVSNTLTSGQSLASGDNAPRGPDAGTAITGAFLGGPGPVLHTAQPSATQPYVSGGGALLIPPNPATGFRGPPTSGGWTRIIALRATGIGAAGPMIIWLYADDPDNVINPDKVYFYLDGTTLQFNGRIRSAALNPTEITTTMASIPAVGSGTTLTDSDWHLIAISLDSTGLTYTVFGDSAAGTSVTLPASGNQSGGAHYDVLGAEVNKNTTNYNWVGDIAFVCELPFAVNGTQWANLTTSWRNAWAGESTDSRYWRVINWVGFPGNRVGSGGLSVDMGPATDIANNNGLQALQNVVDTEGGQHFIGADGSAVFQPRSARYNLTPTVTFGENTTGGEIPYLDAQFDFDPTRVGNDAQVTAQYGNALYRNQDATSQNNYGTVTISRTVNSLDTNELTSAAAALAYQNKDPLTRLKTIVISPARYPNAWPSLLALELGACVRVMRRPVNAAVISMTGFVEQIQWDFDGKGDATCTLQISNNAKHQFWKVEDATYGAPDTTPIAY